MAGTEASLEDMLSTRLSVTSVKVQGGSRTSPHLLSSVTAPILSTGGTFAGVVDDVSMAIERLRATGCFRGVDAYVDRAASGADASVLLTVAEKSLYQLRTGTSIEAAGDRDASLEAALLWRNVRGHADTLKASVNWLGGGGEASFGSDPSTAWSVDYQAPFVLGLNSLVFARVGSVVRSHAEQSSYTLRVRGGELGADLPIGRVSVGSDWREVAAVHDKASPLVREEAGHSWKTYIRHEVGSDSRDSAAMPTQGSTVSLVSEVAVPWGGDVSLAKAEAAAQWHTTLGASGASVCLGARGGAVTARGGQRVGLQDRFFLGGANSLRGFEGRGAGPRDADDAVGGEVFYSGVAMASAPVPQASMLWQLFSARVHAFAVAGDLTEVEAVRRGVKGMVDGEGKVVDRAKAGCEGVYASMRVAVGLGVALETSIGRIELNFCRAIRAAGSDRVKTGFQFGISESFS